MKTWVIPLRTAGIIFIFLLANDLLQNRDFVILLDNLPYIIGLVLAALAVEYGRIYGVKLPQTNKKAQTTLPLIFPNVKGGVK